MLSQYLKDMSDDNGPKFSVLYNDVHAFQISEEAAQRYNYKMGERESWYEPKSAYELSEEVCRHDPLLIQIYHDFQEDFDLVNEQNNTKIQYTKIKKIPEKSIQKLPYSPDYKPIISQFAYECVQISFSFLNK